MPGPAPVARLGQRGIDQVRLAEIARRANMSSGQLMYYFTSKEHILLETLAWQEHRDTAPRRAAVARVTGAWSQLERLIGFYLLDGLALLRLRQMHNPSRKRLTELAMHGARAELAPGGRL